MMWWAVWCAAVVAAGAGAAAAPAPDALGPLQSLDLLQIDNPAPDDDSVDYAMPRVGGRYLRANDEDIPSLYYFAGPALHASQRMSEMHEGRARSKRKMPSLSINNPMEVLRQRLMMEVARKQMREASQRQAVANRVFLQNVGKRGYFVSRASDRYAN